MAVSNFGALNCVHNLGLIARALSAWIEPGGQLVFVFLGRWCAWEIAWHLLHFRPRAALRRLRTGGVDARVGDSMVHVWYPSIGEIRKAFSGGFRLARVLGLGAFLPPSYLEPVVARRPRLFRLLARLDRASGPGFPFAYLADHVILEFERAG